MAFAFPAERAEVDVSTWLTAWRNRKSQESGVPVMELWVVAGADAGCQFTLEGDEVLVCRGQPETGQTDVVRLQDRSISRRQAWIRRDASGTSITHIESASNPTLVNGREIDTARLSEGDRIEMGRVAIDVHARGGMNLHGLTEIMEGAVREAPLGGTSPEQTRTSERLAETTTITGSPERVHPEGEVTEIRPMQVHLGELTIVRDVDMAASGRSTTFPIGMGVMRIGRGEGVEVPLAESGVSRLHAEIAVEGGRIVLIQKSRTNETRVNGFPVLDRVELDDGDEIRLADRVVLGVRLNRPGRSSSNAVSGSNYGLSRQMEDKIYLDRSIEDYNVMGTFLDIDVVDSRGMKGSGARAEHIIVSFERFRAYVAGICGEWDGQVLNSNGDELMCFFESASSAVLAGSAILERLDDFNRDLNLLSQDFHFRLGAHTGISLVDLAAGIAYSEVLDTAGHIQKQADPDTLFISQTTLESLPQRIPVTPAGELMGERRLLYRIDGTVQLSDLEPESGT